MIIKSQALLLVSSLNQPFGSYEPQVLVEKHSEAWWELRWWTNLPTWTLGCTLQRKTMSWSGWPTRLKSSVFSSLPQEGKKLYMQMIDTAFQNFTHTVVPWFFDTFSDSERFSWVVADQHWYTAWDSKNCDMRTDEAGGLTCDTPLETIRHAAHAHWLEMFTMAVKVSDRTISTDGQFELWTTGLPHLYPSELV